MVAASDLAVEDLVQSSRAFVASCRTDLRGRAGRIKPDLTQPILYNLRARVEPFAQEQPRRNDFQRHARPCFLQHARLDCSKRFADAGGISGAGVPSSDRVLAPSRKELWKVTHRFGSVRVARDRQAIELSIEND